MIKKILSRSISIKQTRLVWRIIYFVIYGLAFALSGILAFELRFEFAIEPKYKQYFLFAILIWVSVKILTFSVGRFDREEWSQVSGSDILRIAGANIAGSGASTVVLLALFTGFPRSLLLLDFMICLQATIGLRVMARIARELTARSIGPGVRKRILIYGAGAGGVMLLANFEPTQRPPTRSAASSTTTAENKECSSIELRCLAQVRNSPKKREEQGLQKSS